MKSLESFPRSGVLVHPSERTSRKAVEEAGMVNSRDCFKWAMGSASELENHWLLAKDLHFIDVEMHSQIQPKIIEVKKMLASLIRKIDAERRA